MRTDRKTKGKIAEDLAVSFLENSGYQILERNWRTGRAEVDIIAKDGDILVITEVKSRSYTSYGFPEENISSHKENLLADAAGIYMDSHGYNWEVRFDIISVIFSNNGSASVYHYKDAFFPGLS